MKHIPLLGFEGESLDMKRGRYLCNLPGGHEVEAFPSTTGDGTILVIIFDNEHCRFFRRRRMPKIYSADCWLQVAGIIHEFIKEVTSGGKEA